VHLTNVSDLFLEDDPEFMVAHDYASLVKSYGFWNLANLVGHEPEILLDHPLLQVMRVKREVEDPIGLAWSRDHILPVNAQAAVVQTIVGNSNLIVHELLEQRTTPFTVLMTVYRRANGTCMLSLRSRNGEALQIATRLQGGGHPNASGAALPRSVQSVADAVNYLRQVLNPPSGSTPPAGSTAALFEPVL
jgi:hypothetical protein